MLWIRTNDHGPVPMSLPRLLDEVALAPDVARLVDDLLERKSASKEADEGPRLSRLDSFIVDEIERARHSLGSKPPRDSELLALADLVFLDILRETNVDGPGAAHTL